jgi:hypothetical protein
MSMVQSSTTNVLIIVLLVANLGLSAYTAFRPSPAPAVEGTKAKTTSAVGVAEADKIAESIVGLYNTKDTAALYDKFDQLAKVQITKQHFSSQMEKMVPLIGRIESFAYSHATSAGTQNGREYYILHYKVSLSGGPFSAADMTITVTRNADGLGLFGFFINGISQRSS